MGSLCRHMLTYRPGTCVLEMGGCCVLTRDCLGAASAPFPWLLQEPDFSIVTASGIAALPLPELGSDPSGSSVPPRAWGLFGDRTCSCSGVASLEKVCFHQERRKVHPQEGRDGRVLVVFRFSLFALRPKYLPAFPAASVSFLFP